MLSWFKKRLQAHYTGALPTATENLVPVAPAAPDVPAAPVSETFVRIEELDDAAAVAGHLFRRKFGQEIPAFPRHFVAMMGNVCAGYVHYTAWQGDYLCGGLCINDRVYRTVTAEQRDWLRERGGIAEIMMRAAHACLSDGAVIWGYIGDKQAEAVDRRVGFVPVAEPYLFAIWQKPISDEGKQRRIKQAQALGPF